ncbi:MAG TPA: YCF48-related protein [bacterium]|nr:YCF48-related protein [bacterium]HPR88964.1 YCF48-related protein [bacterium]
MKITRLIAVLLLVLLLLSPSFAAVTLLTPNGNEQWRAGRTKRITWSTVETTTLRLEYQTSPSGPWNEIATAIPSQNLSIPWIVPNIESSTCRVRVTNLANEADFDRSDTTFAITQVVPTTETETNNTATTGNWLEYGDSLHAAISPLGDVDYFCFWGAADDTVEIWGHQRNNSELGARISLFRADGARLTSNNGYLNPPLDQRIVWILPQSGTYYIRYADASNWGNFPNRELVERLEQENWEKMGKNLAGIQWDSTGDYSIGLRMFAAGGPVILQVGGFDYWWNAARFHGYVNTGGLPTTVRFEYGLNTNFDSVSVPAGGPFTSAGPIWINSPVVSGLASSSYYFLRMQATNALGTSISSPFQFSTVAPAEGWERKISGQSRAFADLFFVNDNVGIIAGDSVLIRTGDGGATWTSVFPGSSWIYFKGLSFPDSLTGYAFGSYDHILKTTNAGLTWTPLATGFGSYLMNGFFISPLVGWAISDGGGIYKTTDGGSSWTAQNSGTSNQLLGICFINPDTGMVVGNNIVLRTTNGGTTWSAITTGHATVFRNVDFASPQVGIIVGDEPYVLRTADGGLTWSAITLSTWPDLDMYDVHFFNEEAGIAIGWMGSIFRTTDAGLTWNIQTSGTMNNLLAASHAGSHTTIVGRNNAILRSVDSIYLQSPNGGESWGAGTSHPITWWSDMNGELLLQYRTSSTSGWITIASNVPIASGSYAWTLPAIASDSCKVRISTMPSGTFADISSNVFSIHPTSIQQTLRLSRGWNMISSYISPAAPAMETVMMDVVGRSHLTILKDIGGNVYWPEYLINLIGNWNPLNGYQCYLSVADSVILNGQMQTPESTPISLTNGWSMVAYLRSSAYDAAAAFTSISARLVIAKNGAGDVYWPEYAINTIGNLLPGQGYQLYLNAAGTLTYPANGASSPKNVMLSALSSRPTQHYPSGVLRSGSSATLLVEGAFLQDNDEIAVIDAEGRGVGAAVAQGGRALITIHGDDENTTESEGSRVGAALKLTYWSNTGKVEAPLQILSLKNGLNGSALPTDLCYQRDAVWVAELADVAAIPHDYALRQNYPNPFNPATCIRFELPKESEVQLVVYNLRGQAIRTLFDGAKKAGYHELVWDGRDQSGLMVASGLYLLRMEAGAFKTVMKMSFIK